MITSVEYENMPENLRKLFNKAHNLNDLASYKEFEKEYKAYQKNQSSPISDLLKTIFFGKKS